MCAAQPRRFGWSGGSVLGKLDWGASCCATVGELYLEAPRLGLGRVGGGPLLFADYGKQRILLNPKTKAKANGWTRMVGRGEEGGR